VAVFEGSGLKSIMLKWNFFNMVRYRYRYSGAQFCIRKDTDSKDYKIFEIFSNLKQIS
jgi:hypothetical protein